MILKLIALGIKKYMKVAWNVFDGVIVIMSIVDTTMEYAKINLAGGALSVLRTFRLVCIWNIRNSLWAGEEFILQYPLKKFSLYLLYIHFQSNPNSFSSSLVSLCLFQCALLFYLASFLGFSQSSPI